MRYIEDAEPQGFPYCPGDSASAQRRQRKADYREEEAAREARFSLLLAAVALRSQAYTQLSENDGTLGNQGVNIGQATSKNHEKGA